MLEDLIIAATNEALRKVEEESTAVMSKLTGGLGGLGGGPSILMEYYSSHINKLIEQLSPSSGNRCEISTETGISHHEHAERPGRPAYFIDHQCQRECAVLQMLLHAYRQRNLPDLQ